MLASTRLASWTQEEAKAAPADMPAQDSSRSRGHRATRISLPPRTHHFRSNASGSATGAGSKDWLTAAAAAAAVVAELAVKATGMESDALFGESPLAIAYLCCLCHAPKCITPYLPCDTPGCPKCKYLRFGCGSCRSRPPTWTRPRLRWRPAEGHHQAGIEDAPVFRPTAAEFRDPVAYISRWACRRGIRDRAVLLLTFLPHSPARQCFNLRL